MSDVMTSPLNIGDTRVVQVKTIGINGEGIAFVQRQAVFIPGALPGEEVHIRVVRVEKTYAVATLLNIHKASPERVTPPCPIYERCGGCQLQHLSYQGQLSAKEALIRESFARYTGHASIPLRPIIGMNHPWAYRNKAQLMTGQVGKKVIAGLYAMGTHRLIDLSDCPVQHPRVNETILKTKEIIAALHVPVYDEKKKRGRVRTIVARVSLLTEEVQLTLVLAEDYFPEAKDFVRAIRQSLPYVVSIHMNVQDQHTPLVFGDKTHLLWGKEKIEEALGHVRYELSPRAFFQLNPIQTIRLYELVEEAAGLTGKESVVDAYAGVGTIALWLAPYAREVRGIESVPEAVKDAERNIKRAGYDHVHITMGRAEKVMQRWAKSGYKPDVVVVDPPRSGLEPAMIQAILSLVPKRLVYVSCNPSTLAKNAQVLLKGGYRLKWVRPVDMFPQTAHVESCALFTR